MGDTSATSHVPSDQTPLVRGLLAAQAYPHAVTQLRLIETPTAWVVLTGSYAYKIRKPVVQEGSDCSTLERRRSACEEEVRLNRGLAPELYAEVVPITGTADAPQADGQGPVIEYAVRMKEFPQSDRLDRRLAAGRFETADIKGLASTIAQGHGAAVKAFTDGAHASAGSAERKAAADLEWLWTHTRGRTRARVQSLAAWIASRGRELAALMAARRSAGFVREVHGDLCLAHFVKMESRILPFGCAEAGSGRRWTDVMSDLAVLTTDLHARGRTDLAYAVLNRYLEATSDYDGVALLRYFEVHCALERARLACDDAGSCPASTRLASARAISRYVRLAEARSTAEPAALILMHGLTGSGKTWLSAQLMARLPAIRIRADVERTRLHGLRSGATPTAGLRATAHPASESDLTYDHLAQVACAVLHGGESVILDATLLRRPIRLRFLGLAQSLHLPCAIVSCRAPMPELRRRLARRAGQTPGLPPGRHHAVLAHQLACAETLDKQERAVTVTIDTDDVRQVDAIVSTLRSRLNADASRMHPRVHRHGSRAGVPPALDPSSAPGRA